jgi:tRNA threonylcarbamoyladenosine biosynthesis protein TsaE
MVHLVMMKEENIHISQSLDDTRKIARKLIKSIDHKSAKATVLFFQGNLGAGKTTLTQAIGRELGIRGTIISPTFILQKKYTTTHPKFKYLIHIDAYRFEHPEEAAVLSLEESLSDSNTLVIIEWPEKIGKQVTASKIVQLESLTETSKQISWQ